jgi:hypothetical protein
VPQAEVQSLLKLESLRQEIANEYASLTVGSFVESERRISFDARIAKGEGLLRLKIHDLMIVPFRQPAMASCCRPL